MAVTGPKTNFQMQNADGGPNTQDLGDRYVSKDYLLDVYPNLVSSTGNRTSPGIWAWGHNLYGQLGLTNITQRSSPTQIGSLTNWKQVANGFYHTVAAKTDGTLWSWGHNSLYGMLGLNDLTHRSSPVQVGSLTNWKQVAGGFYHTAAVKTDGTLWAWGYNNGALGLGSLNVAHRSSPVQVGSLTNWKLVAVGSYFTVALKTDGTLWSFGANNIGALGLNDTTARSSPVQIGTATDWKLVAVGAYHVLAVKNNGTLWAWGFNTNGNLGLGDIAHRSSPVQVGSLTNWKQAAGGYLNTVAIKTDGTLWSWGYNLYGGLGQSSIIHRSSPVQVGSLTNWKLVISGAYHTIAQKTDGTLWGWGLNNYGQLGIDSVTRSSPVQIGSLTTWKQVSAGFFHTAAIQDGLY